MTTDRISTLLDEIKADRQKVTDKSQPLRDKREALQAKIAPLEAQVRELTEQIQAVETDKLFNFDKQIGTLSKALGAKSLSADGNAS